MIVVGELECVVVFELGGLDEVLVFERGECGVHRVGVWVSRAVVVFGELLDDLVAVYWLFG